MLSYPPHKISSSAAQTHVLQITDLHLSTYDMHTKSSSHNVAAKDSCRHNFEAILQQALAEDIHCDLILVTGDLVNKVETAIYDYIFAVLKATQIPFACIAGNHDVTDEVGSELSFEQRQLVARPADPRLLSRHVIETNYWQLLLLDSTVPGAVAGKITDSDIDWLCEQLSCCNKPTLIALHHHILPVQSAWIDAHIAKNTEIFWQRTAPFKHLRTIINGHTHQQHLHYRNGVIVYTTPSTCYQYQPYNDDFAVDVDARPGYRWLQLANNGQVVSWVKRLDT